MRRGTTPTLRITVEGIQVESLTSIFLTLKQGNTELEKTNVEVDTENNRLIAELSQEETLMFDEGGVRVQFRALLENGKAVASNIVTTTMDEILMEGVIA